MKKNLILKLLGGITITFSVFLLLIVLSRFNQTIEGAKYVFSGEARQTMLTNLTSPTTQLSPKTATNENSSYILTLNSHFILEGFFNPTANGEIIIKSFPESKNPFTKHYKVIQSQELKNPAFTAILELETENDNQIAFWTKGEEIKIDKENGNIQFLLKTETPEKIILPGIYTGKYRLKFQPIQDYN